MGRTSRDSQGTSRMVSMGMAAMNSSSRLQVRSTMRMVLHSSINRPMAIPPCFTGYRAARMTSRKSWAYLWAFLAPTPLTWRNCSWVSGRLRAMSSRVALEKIW